MSNTEQSSERTSDELTMGSGNHALPGDTVASQGAARPTQPSTSEQMVWISIKDALPAYRRQVLLYTAKDEATLGYRKSTDHAGEHFEGEYSVERDSCDVNGVTHWMPLPKVRP
jgi:hypothetical protein